VVYYYRKFSGIFHMFNLPDAPPVQICPLRSGLKSTAKTDPSCSFVDIISGTLSTPNFEIFNS
jgi:hypothetical protein